MSFIDFKEVKENVSIEQAVAMLKLDMKRVGAQMRCTCPTCGGGDRSLVVTPEKNAYYCFSSKKGGDVIGLVSHVTGADTKSAALQLSELYSTGKVQVPSGGRVQVPEEKPEGRRALEPLGYLQAEHEKVQSLGVQQSTAAHFGAGYAGKGMMRGRFAIPIHTRTGELIAYCGRALGEEVPVMMFPQNFNPSHFIFNAHRIEQDDVLYVVRDPLHVLSAFENGVTNVVSFLSDITAESLDALSVLMTEKGVPSIELL